MRIGLTWILAAAAMMLPGAAQAQESEAGFQTYLVELRAQAQGEGVSRRTLDAVFPTLTYNPRVVELDRGQPGSTSSNAPIPMYEQYRRRHMPDILIQRGRNAYAQERARIARIERDTGVPGSILIAIWGNETNYGRIMGNFDLPRSLASLAYEGRRRALFSSEFIATLKMMDRGIPREKLLGSWAGAFGGPQFLPSVYLRLAADGDGDGVADIWDSEADTLASIANYFVEAGWRRGQPWGLKVSVPAGLNRARIANKTVSPRCPRVHERHSQWKSIAEWRALGFVPLDKAWPDGKVMATLLEPDGEGKPGYLLTGNYRVILDYNCSNFYALTVGLLSDEVDR